MYTYNTDIREIIQKYEKEEELIDKLVKHKVQCENVLEQVLDDNVVTVSLSDAVKRNKELLIELEITKGRLRSKAIFSPAEIQWDAICERYQKNPALPVTTWRCHLPV